MLISVCLDLDDSIFPLPATILWVVWSRFVSDYSDSLTKLRGHSLYINGTCGHFCCLSTWILYVTLKELSRRSIWYIYRPSLGRWRKSKDFRFQVTRREKKKMNAMMQVCPRSLTSSPIPFILLPFYLIYLMYLSILNITTTITTTDPDYQTYLPR